MTVREKMIDYRVFNNKTHRVIAIDLNISPGLLDMIESGDVTHPKIADRIQKYYGFTDEEREELVPEIHRKSSPRYSPDEYRAPEDNGTIIPRKKGYEDDPYYLYINERRKYEKV